MQNIGFPPEYKEQENIMSIDFPPVVEEVPAQSNPVVQNPVSMPPVNVEENKVTTPVTSVQPTNPNESKPGWRSATRKAGRGLARALAPEKLENWAVGSKEDEAFLKQYNNSNVPTYEQILNDFKANKITKDQVKELSERRNKLDTLTADAEYRNVRNKNIGKGALELGTAAIGGGAGTAAAKGVYQAGKQGLKQFAKKTALESGNLAKIGAGYGAAQGVIDEDINPLTEAGKQALIWGATNAAVAGGGKAIQTGVNKARTFKQAKLAKAKDNVAKTETINENMLEGSTTPVKVKWDTNTPETNLTHVNEPPTSSNMVESKMKESALAKQGF